MCVLGVISLFVSVDVQHTQRPVYKALMYVYTGKYILPRLLIVMAAMRFALLARGSLCEQYEQRDLRNVPELLPTKYLQR